MVGRHAAVIQCVYNLWLQINLSIICSWLMTANNLFSTNSCLFCSAWDIISQSASSFILFGLSERPTHYHTRPRFFLCVFGFTHFVFLFCFHVGIYFAASSRFKTVSCYGSARGNCFFVCAILLINISS